MTDTMETLAEKAEAMAAEHRRVPSLDMVRAALNESGIRRARPAMHDSLDILANAQETLRSTQAVEAAAKEAYDAALAEASWECGDRVRREGVKSFVAVHLDVDGAPAEERQVSADEAKAWVAAEAAKQPAVTMVAAVLSNAAAETAAARDSVEVARLRCSIARHEVDAAVAELEALVVGIPR